ncbi:site-2 protease family protein [Luteimonas sp. TWI1416]|uniref:site-2 protease family protein n=2 Tax=Luteimonas TaxID=83614 RepID=UPI003208DFF5
MSATNARSSMPHEADIAALMPPPDAPASSRTGLRRLLPTLRGAIGGAVVGVGAAMIGIPLLDALPPGALTALLLGFVLSIWPHVVLHEAGHAVAGLSRGMRAIAFGVGPFRCERRGTRWRWRRGGRLHGIGGFAALLPQGTRGLSRLDQAVFLLGGPMANLLTAVLLLACARWLPLPVHLAAACIGSAIAAALLGLGNLLPLQLSGWRLDGRVLLDLLRRTPDAALHLQISQLMALSLAGVRPRDWPEAAIPVLSASLASDGLALSGRMLRLSHAIDRRDAGAARADAVALTAAFASAPAVSRGPIAVTLASHAALLVGDRALLAAWRLRCDGGLLDLSPYRAWLDAELARLDGDAGALTTHLADARALAERIPDAASRMVFDDRLEALAQALQSEV